MHNFQAEPESVLREKSTWAPSGRDAVVDEDVGGTGDGDLGVGGGAHKSAR